MRPILMTTIMICCSLFVGGLYIEYKVDIASGSTNIEMADPLTITLKSAPIRKDWILEGDAKAMSGQIGFSHDGTTYFSVWRVNAGRFNWFYDFDETVTIIDGDVYLTDGANAAPGNIKERHLGPGDVVFFHIGSTATWRVPDHVRKIATVKYAMPAPVLSFARWYQKLRKYSAPPSAVVRL